MKLRSKKYPESRIEMKKISTNAENEIKAYLAKWWASTNQQISEATGNSIQIGKEAPIEMLLASEIGQCLVRIAQAAENLIDWSPKMAQSTLVDCAAFETWLNQSTVSRQTPEEFWNIPIGYMLLKARLWAEQDRLTSLKEAADISGLSLSSLSQRVSRGQMKYYRDPFEANPQRARRVRLTDLEHFIHEGIMRKPNAAVVSRFNLPNQSSQFQISGDGGKDEKMRP